MTQQRRIQPRFQFSRRHFLGGVGALGMLSLAGCAGGTKTESKTLKSLEVDGDLNFLTWSEYMAPEVIEGFEEEYGVKVHFSYGSQADEIITKIASGEPYDLAVMMSQDVLRLGRGGVLNTIDHDALSNQGELIPEFEVPPYSGADDADNKETVQFVGAPYAVGGIGLTWRRDKITDLTESFSDLWRNKEAGSGHLYMLGEMQTAMSIALLSQGLSPHDASEADLQAAGEAIEELKPYLGGIVGAGTQMIENGEAWMMPAFAGDIYNALEEIPDPDNWGFQTCTESALFNVDTFVCPAAGKSPGTALAFIDWLLRPENAQANVEYTGYAIPTKSGMEMFRDLTQEFPFIQTDEALFSDPSQWMAPIPEDQTRLWQQVWNSVKA